MKIGELARLSGLAASRIRFYEASGLLQPAPRQSNGYREYAPDTLTRLEIIHRAQSAGFSLEEIRSVLPPDLDKWDHASLLESLRRKVSEIDALQQRLAESKAHLVALIGEIDSTPEGEDCSGRARRVLEQMNQGAGREAGTARRRA